jgi:hypothetical protein
LAEPWKRMALLCNERRIITFNALSQWRAPPGFSVEVFVERKG